MNVYGLTHTCTRIPTNLYTYIPSVCCLYLVEGRQLLHLRSRPGDGAYGSAILPKKWSEEECRSQTKTSYTKCMRVSVYTFVPPCSNTTTRDRGTARIMETGELARFTLRSIGEGHREDPVSVGRNNLTIYGKVWWVRVSHTVTLVIGMSQQFLQGCNVRVHNGFALNLSLYKGKKYIHSYSR